MDEFSFSILAMARATGSSARVLARLKMRTWVLGLNASANLISVSYETTGWWLDVSVVGGSHNMVEGIHFFAR